MRQGEVWLLTVWNCAVFTQPIHNGEQILTFPTFQGLLHWGQRTRQVKLPAHRAGLPGNVVMITRSALTPVLESVSALPAPATGRKAGHPADLPVNKTSPGAC